MAQTGFAPDAEPLEADVQVLPQPLDRGAPARVLLRGLPEGAAATGEFDQKPIFFFETEGVLVGLFGADVMLEPGSYPLKVAWTSGSRSGSAAVDVAVRDKSYGVRNIKVPQRQVDLSDEDLARTKRESELTRAALATRSPERLWKGQFIEPVNGSINSSFGRQTRLNGILNARPHAGADYLVGEGVPVKAPAAGKVILTGNHFFAGNSIYIDHGQGLISMYFHLSAIEVKDGDMVERGQIIGKVGKTGRVTGAHLHYGVYINGARIDPPVFRRMVANLLGVS
jgi:murein DD-endopeptidase MepM/ murein hydrolase activator NlpD